MYACLVQNRAGSKTTNSSLVDRFRERNSISHFPFCLKRNNNNEIVLVLSSIRRFFVHFNTGQPLANLHVTTAISPLTLAKHGIQNITVCKTETRSRYTERGNRET